MNINNCLDRPEDKKDERDYQLASIMPEVEIPEKFLIENLSPVFRQKYGSCTSAASVNGVKEQQEQKALSEYFNYVNSKKISGIYNQQGEYIKNALKAICDYGVCEQELFPDVYPASRQWIDYVKKEPSTEAYKNAEKYKGKTYWSMDSYQRNFREALFVFKTPIVFVMKWYSSYNKCDGVLPLPDNWVANHAVCAVGYDEEYLIVKNSFGTGWGEDGYFYIPFKDWEKHTIYSPWILLDKDKTMTNVKLVKKDSEVGFYLPATNQESLIAMGKHYGIEIPLLEDGTVNWKMLENLIDYKI